MARCLASAVPLLARLLLASPFAWSGYRKLFVATGPAAAQIAGKGLPFATVFAYGAGAVEVLVALLLGLGLKTRSAALLAVAYLGVVTWLFHVHPAARGDFREQMTLLRNVGLAGGMLLLAAFGPGPASVDRG